MMSYFTYFEGAWQVVNSAGGVTGSMTIRRGEGGACHILEYRLGDERRTELWGYDPTGKRWMAVGFTQNGERYSQVMMDVPTHRNPKAGDRFWDKHDGMLPSGEKTSARLEFHIESQDAYAVKVTNASVGASRREDASFRITRKR